MSVTAVSSYSDLVVDYTIEDDAGSGGVPTSFTIAGTLPVRINGGASADLSTSPLTVSANQFGDAAAGIVPLSGGGTTNFLRADGTWAAPSGGGLNYQVIQDQAVDLTQRGKLNFRGLDIQAYDDAANSVTVAEINRFDSILGGTVKASGGGTANFLRADGNWINPTTGLSIVSLQGSYPGTADSGHAHISGSFGADVSLVAGTNTPAVNSRLYLKGTTADATTIPTAVLVRHTADDDPAWIAFRKSRGIEGAPGATVADDLLGAISVAGTKTGLGFSEQYVFTASADGNASASEQATYVDMLGGGAAGLGRIRHSATGTAIGNQSTIATATRAKSTLDVLGSLSLRRVAKTEDFTPGAADCLFLCDMTLGGSTFSNGCVLPTAVGVEGRVYGFMKTDTTAFILDVAADFSQSISGVSGVRLSRRGESVVIVSDGANWFILASNIFVGKSNAADGAAVVSTTTETIASSYSVGSLMNRVGNIWTFRASGKFSTTGTPTLRFKVKTASNLVLLDSGAVTMPNDASSHSFQIQGEFVNRDIAASAAYRPSSGVLMVAQAAGAGAAMNMYNMVDVAASTVIGGPSPGKVTLQWGTASASNTATVIEAVTTMQEGGVE